MHSCEKRAQPKSGRGGPLPPSCSVATPLPSSAWARQRAPASSQRDHLSLLSTNLRVQWIRKASAKQRLGASGSGVIIRMCQSEALPDWATIRDVAASSHLRPAESVICVFSSSPAKCEKLPQETPP